MRRLGDSPTKDFLVENLTSHPPLKANHIKGLAFKGADNAADRQLVNQGQES